MWVKSSTRIWIIWTYFIKFSIFNIKIEIRTNGIFHESLKNDVNLFLLPKIKDGSKQIPAKNALEGVQLPISGFRGSGLAWMIDILSGVLTGGNHAGRVKDPFDDFSGPQNIGHLFITFKTNLFVKNYNTRIKDNIRRIKRLPKIKGVKEIMYPGQNKYKRFKMNTKKKIKISKIIEKDFEILKH